MTTVLLRATPLTLPPARVARSLHAACLAELRAFKPGNVSVATPGHGMTARDFIASSRAAAPALTSPAAHVGERILRAVEATHAAAGCNTNLGIVLLCAPLAHAVLYPRLGAELRERVEDVLAALDRRDAELAYRAIRLAAPGGLGTAPEHDVRAEPRVTLREAMQAAAARDRIAYQYAHGFADVFDLALPHLKRAAARHGTLRLALLDLYLTLLASFPDSHVVRQHGAPVAAEVSGRAAQLAAALASAGATERFVEQLRALDAELKRREVNPGTSADLTVAALFAWRLERELAAEAALGGMAANAVERRVSQRASPISTHLKKRM